MTQPEETQLARPTPRIIRPADLDDIVASMKAFEMMKEKLITDDDFMTIQGKRFIKKSGLMKYALACRLSLSRVEERREYDEKKDEVTYHFVYRAESGGQFIEAVGSASSKEKKNVILSEHNTRALAQTRAQNRAISNMVAAGQVSAEEMEGEHEVKQPSEAELKARDAAKNFNKNVVCPDCKNRFATYEEMELHRREHLK